MPGRPPLAGRTGAAAFGSGGGVGAVEEAGRMWGAFMAESKLGLT